VLHNMLAVSSPHLFPYAPRRKKERRELLNLQSAATRSALCELAQAETEWQLKVIGAPTTCPTVAQAETEWQLKVICAPTTCPTATAR
jgi:hypothetical protein